MEKVSTSRAIRNPEWIKVARLGEQVLLQKFRLGENKNGFAAPSKPALAPVKVPCFTS